jgi:hypothetical protein
MYAWATPERLLYDMTLDQWIHYYRKGWECKETEMKMNWGILAQFLNPDSNDSSGKKQSNVNIEELRHYKGYENAYFDENGKFHKE